MIKDVLRGHVPGCGGCRRMIWMQVRKLGEGDVYKPNVQGVRRRVFELGVWSLLC